MGSTAFKSVRTKILATFLVAAFGMLGASGFTMLKLSETYRLVEQAKTRQLAPSQDARATLAGIYAFHGQRITALQFAAMPGGMSIARIALAHAWDTLGTTEESAAKLAADQVPASAAQLVSRFLQIFAAQDAAMRPAKGLSVEQLAASFAKATTDPKMVAEQTKLTDELQSTGVAVVAALAKAAAADQVKAKGVYDSGRRAAVVMVILALTVSVGLGLIIAQTIRRPLKKTVKVLEGVADGDLTQRLIVHSADEVGQMAAALNQTLSTVHDVIEQIESDASKLSDLAEAGRSGVGFTPDTVDELAAMAGNLSAMISIFQTERSKT
jgi:methyl-accepting chemotaxis protein